MPKVGKDNNLQQNAFPLALTAKLRYLQSLGYYLEFLGNSLIFISNLFWIALVSF